MTAAKSAKVPRHFSAIIDSVRRFGHATGHFIPNDNDLRQGDMGLTSKLPVFINSTIKPFAAELQYLKKVVRQVNFSQTLLQRTR